ncbi:MAG: hypothetical protein JNG82_11110 [Opitutaceae bacterium]|nr:hypothetical protein [Opitutaceae bacterium]
MIEHVLAKLPEVEAATKLHATQIGNPLYQELVGFLSGLPREQMLALITIMYFGRDDCTSIVSMQEHCHVTFPDSRAMAHQMLEKSPALPRYFAAAKRRAWLDGIDLDRLPQPLST